MTSSRLAPGLALAAALACVGVPGPVQSQLPPVAPVPVVEDAPEREVEAPWRRRVRAIQRALIERGYRPGPADGIPGPRTRTAIEAFERDAGLRITGKPSSALLDLLVDARHDAGPASALPDASGLVLPGSVVLVPAAVAARCPLVHIASGDGTVLAPSRQGQGPVGFALYRGDVGPVSRVVLSTVDRTLRGEPLRVVAAGPDGVDVHPVRAGRPDESGFALPVALPSSALGAPVIDRSGALRGVVVAVGGGEARAVDPTQALRRLRLIDAPSSTAGDHEALPLPTVAGLVCGG